MSSADRAAPPTPAPSDAPDGRRVAANFLLLTAGELVAKLLTFAAFAYLGRALGPGSYGSLEFVLAVMVFFTLPAEIGLYGAREIAKGGRHANELLGEIAELRLLLTLAAVALLLVFTALIHKEPEVKTLLALYGLSLFATPALLQWFFQGTNQMHWVALASIVRQGVFAGLLFLFLRPGTPLATVGLIECASLVAVSAFCVGVLRLRLGVPLPRPRFRPHVWLEHLREAAPIGLSNITWSFLWYFPTVLMGFLAAGSALGWFGASHRVVMALHTFVWLYFFNLLPSIARCVALPRETLQRLLHTSMATTAWSSLFVALFTSLLASQAMRAAYGAAFAGAGATLAVLVWIVPVLMISGHHRFTLIAYGQQRLEFRSSLLAAGVAVALSFALIPRYGSVGASLAVLLATLVNFALAYACVRRTVGTIPFAGHLVRPLIATLTSLAAYLALARWTAWVPGTAEGIAALLFLLLLVILEPEVARGLRRLARREVPWRRLVGPAGGGAEPPS